MFYEKFVVNARSTVLALRLESLAVRSLCGTLQACSVRGLSPPSKLLAASVLKHVYHSPKFGFDPQEEMDGEEVERLVAAVTDAIADDEGPAVETIRMQVLRKSTWKLKNPRKKPLPIKCAFAAGHLSRASAAARHARRVETRVAPLVREIVYSGPTTTGREVKALYARLVSLLVLRSGLGDPTDPRVIREAAAAAGSVFPQHELPRRGLEPHTTVQNDAVD